MNTINQDSLACKQTVYFFLEVHIIVVGKVILDV